MSALKREEVRKVRSISEIATNFTINPITGRCRNGVCVPSIFRVSTAAKRPDPPLESQTERAIFDLHGATISPFPQLLSRGWTYLFLTQQTFAIVYRWIPFIFASRGVRKVVAPLLHRVLICTITVQFILSGISGITSHVASQADTVAQNAHSITLAFCVLPIPFKDVICTRTSDVTAPMSPFNPNVDHFSMWNPFLIDEDVHGPAIDLAIRKAANATSTVLALVRASDLTQRHEISDKLKDFLQRAWACEVMSGTHVALVKTTVDE